MDKVDIDKLPRTRLLFLGTEYYKGTKQNDWADLRDLPNDGSSLQSLDGMYEVRTFPMRKGMSRILRNPGRPGIIYSFPYEEVEGSLSIYSGHGEIDGRWKNEADVLTWQAKHDAQRNAHESAVKEDKYRKKNVVGETLAPLREAYRQLNWRERQQMLAHVIREITK